MSAKREFKYGDTSNIEPFWANKETVTRLFDRTGSKMPADIVSSFREGVEKKRKVNRNFRMALETCIHCGACLNACPTYIATGDIRNSPVGRADLIRRATKRFGRSELDEKRIKEIATFYYQCVQCRKCGEICPFGIDQADVTRTVRSILYDVGIISRNIGIVIDNSETTGNNMGLPKPAIKAVIDFAKDEIKEEKGVDLKVKVDEHAYAALIPTSADFYSNIDTLKGYMWFLHSIGMDYTFATDHAEMGNFALYTDERHMSLVGNHLVSTAKKLGVKLVIVGECGHGWRTFKNYVVPELRKNGMDGVHIFHIVVDAIKRGSIKLDKAQNGDSLYVYQDPCNYARGGDLIEEPRTIIGNVVKTYQDSPHSKRRGWCCGGSAGLITDELLPLAVEYAKLWYNDATSVGADVLVRPCSICKAQLSHTMPILNKMYSKKLKYSGMMDLVYNALN